MMCHAEKGTENSSWDKWYTAHSCDVETSQCRGTWLSVPRGPTTEIKKMYYFGSLSDTSSLAQRRTCVTAELYANIAGGYVAPAR